MGQLKTSSKIQSSLPSVGSRGYNKFFTEAEAGKCEIIRADSVERDSTHVYWDIEVKDELGNLYAWEDHNSGGSSTASISHI